MGATFWVLGELKVFSHQSAVTITAGRQEVVLAALLLENGRLLSSDHLIRLLWGEDPPETARTQVQICVSRIRKALASAHVEAAIVTRPPGYLLRIGDMALDLGIFRSLVAESRTLVAEGREDVAADRLRSAVSLWDGPCLHGVPSEALARAAQRIDEERLAATETFLDLELAMGRHHQLTAEMGRLVDDNPLRERFRGQLMLALHRSGRQAEALEVYRRGRALLQEELGLEPGKDLRRLEHAILTDDPALRLPQGPVTLAPHQAADEHPGEHAEALERLPVATPAVVPRQLPVDTADFVGHQQHVAEAEDVLTQTSSQRATGIVVVVGRPGVGKSTFATRVAHRLSEDHFPDGQLFCRLRGGRTDPVSPQEVLGRFLRALGIPGPAVPDSLEERAEMYRSLLADRRILVVLDDAAAEEQILPLLPGSRTCGVLVTSRARLTALPGAHRVQLDILQQPQSLELIGKVIGADRVAAEPEAARALVCSVGGLPLALRIVAARLAARPHWSLASMVQRLADEQRRLDELAHGELTVRASLSLTYDGLAENDRRLLRLLSLPKGSTFPGWIGGALLDDPHPQPSDLLEPLVDVQMLDVAGVEADGALRYGFHDIIRLFASDRLHAESQAAERRAALRRMGGAWLSLVTRAHHGAFGDYFLIAGSAERWDLPENQTRALLARSAEWLESERESLSLVVEDLAQQGEDEYAWEIAVNLAWFYEARGYLDDWDRTHAKALAAVRRANNLRGQAAVQFSLGSLHINRWQLQEARKSLTFALDSFEKLAATREAGLCRRDLGNVQWLAGDEEAALRLFDQAERDLGDDWVRSTVLTARSPLLIRQGDFERAEAELQVALDIQRARGLGRGQARTLQRMGQLCLRRGQAHEARDALTRALEMVVTDGDVIGEGYLLHDLGRVNERLGLSAEAASCFEKSIAVRDHILDRTGAAAVRMDLAEMWLRGGDAVRARALLEIAVEALAAPALAERRQRAERMLAMTPAARVGHV
ncbi:SARP family transcriptional regulator [Streptomyces antibioticus]|nr:BTAD domain-containing putative transcriptional regulator [Streptomyces antibioticus]KUN18836.1 SARP family transcriptional regulator [Streptomyces antibioticus]